MTHCASCGAESSPDQRFCASCGASLEAPTCPSCHNAVQPGANFCGQCGTRLAEATEALRLPDASAPRPTERRLVSVLFADLVGFTALSEDEDPEAVREFLSAYFERASQVIDRYGGTVEKFIGDAVMAVWGTPTAHEDDAERAVRAAIELTSIVGSLEQETQLRVAVMTGEAAVMPEADHQGLVAGDLVNTSSRLQGVARPGQVLVDETTMVAAGRAVAFETAGEFTLKGKTEPLRAWQALDVVAERGGSGRREVLEPPFVGRAEELRQLKDALHAPGRDGATRLVTVIGQAGMGKSRLAWELKKYSDGVTESIYWHEGQSPSYGEGVAYRALVEMVRERCRVEEQDADHVRERLSVTLAELVPDADERTWMEPRLGALLGVAEAPGGDREELFAAWRTFFERIADQGTTALIFEDLHWGDDSLLDFIEHLLEWARSKPIVVVCMARPELLDRRPGWGSGQRAATTLHLEALSDDDMGDLLRGLVPGSPEVTLTQIVQRAEGVPLYAVETVRMLLDEGRLVRAGERYRLTDVSAPVATPASLQSLVAARLDALPAAERSLVQEASVLGKSFLRPALAAVSGRDERQLEGLLAQLSRKQIVAVESGRNIAEKARYGFVQGLLRDVAYSTLSRRDRRGWHLAAARYYESLADDELAGLVATHCFDAYEAMPDGEDGAAAAALARVALRAAAERSVALHANKAAVGFIDRALSVTEDPEQRAELGVLAGDPAWASGDIDDGERYIRPAIDWYLANDRDDEADAAIVQMAAYMVHTDRAHALQEILESRVARFDDTTAGPTAPRLLNELGRSYLFAGCAEDAWEPLERGLAIAERLIDEPAIAELFATKSWASGLVGRHAESELLAQGSIDLAQRHGMISTELRGRMNLSDLLIGSAPRQGKVIATAGVELAERIGHISWAAALAGNESFAGLVLGDWDAAIDRSREMDRPQVSHYARVGLLSTGAVARAYLGLPGAAVQDPHSDDFETRADLKQSVAALDAFRAWEAFASGNLEVVDLLAFRSMSGTAVFGEAALALCQAVHATIWLGDRERVQMAVENTTNHGWAGLVKSTTIRQGMAALAALDGDIDHARGEYAETLATWRRLEMEPDVAVALMEMLKLFGDRLDDPEGVAVEARTILDDLGAVSLLERLDSIIPTSTKMEVPT